MRNNIRKVICPVCANTTTLHLTDAEAALYDRYMSGNLEPDEQRKPIQALFPKLSPSYREVILTGICDKCYTNICDQNDDC